MRTRKGGSSAVVAGLLADVQRLSMCLFRAETATAVLYSGMNGGRRTKFDVLMIDEEAMGQMASTPERSKN